MASIFAKATLLTHFLSTYKTLSKQVLLNLHVQYWEMYIIIIVMECEFHWSFWPILLQHTQEQEMLFYSQNSTFFIMSISLVKFFQQTFHLSYTGLLKTKEKKLNWCLQRTTYMGSSQRCVYHLSPTDMKNYIFERDLT